MRGARIPCCADVTHWLLQIEAECRDMPGLQLTERQMQRLWGIDGQSCSEIVAALVATGILRETAEHAYVSVARAS